MIAKGGRRFMSNVIDYKDILKILFNKVLNQKDTDKEYRAERQLYRWTKQDKYFDFDQLNN